MYLLIYFRNSPADCRELLAQIGAPRGAAAISVSSALRAIRTSCQLLCLAHEPLQHDALTVSGEGEGAARALGRCVPAKSGTVLSCRSGGVLGQRIRDGAVPLGGHAPTRP